MQEPAIATATTWEAIAKNRGYPKMEIVTVEAGAEAPKGAESSARPSMRRVSSRNGREGQGSPRHCPDGKPGVSCRRRPTSALPPKAPSLDRGPAAMPVCRLRKTRTCRWRRGRLVPVGKMMDKSDAGGSGKGSAEDGEGGLGLRDRNRAQPQRTLERGDREHNPGRTSRFGTGLGDRRAEEEYSRSKGKRSGTNDGWVEKLKKKLLGRILMKRRAILWRD
jgi:hypothetical protein